MKKTIDATRIFSLIFAMIMAFSCICTYAPIKAEAATLAQQKQNIENKLFYLGCLLVFREVFVCFLHLLFRYI